MCFMNICREKQVYIKALQGYNKCDGRNIAVSEKGVFF